MNHVFTISVLMLWLVRGGTAGIYDKLVVFDKDIINDCPSEFTLLCGTNAHCQVNEVPECVCDDGHDGNPYDLEGCGQVLRRKRDIQESETEPESESESLTESDTSTTLTNDDPTNSAQATVNDDICLPNPCLNGGTCQKLGSYFACICPVPFCGWYCEKVQGDETDECEEWAKKGYCANDFKEFMLSNCEKACNDWYRTQPSLDDPEGSASGWMEDNDTALENGDDDMR